MDRLSDYIEFRHIQLMKHRHDDDDSEETKMLPRSIPPLTKEEFKEFQKEIQREPSKELVETLKRAKAVYESKAL